MKIDSSVLKVLSQATCEGNLLRLNGQLDRKLYEATNKVLVEAGGKWKSGKTKAHVFDADAADVIEPILLTGEIAQEFGAFFTPDALSREIVERSEIAQMFARNPELRALEPSAGVGNIAGRLAIHCKELIAVEIQEKHVATLRKRSWLRTGCTVLQTDFLDLTPDAIGRFDCVVMNPPFSKRADVLHVLHAARFLKPGGTLTAIMSAGVMYRDDKPTRSFHDLIDRTCGRLEELPEGAFKESGTMVRTVIASMKFSEPVMEYEPQEFSP